MMRFSTLMKHPADWMTGADTDSAIVLTSRIRLARNISGAPFPGWARKNERMAILPELRDKVETLPEMKDAFSHQLSELSSVQKKSLWNATSSVVNRLLGVKAAPSSSIATRHSA